jgi:hypothetical protein
MDASQDLSTDHGLRKYQDQCDAATSRGIETT